MKDAPVIPPFPSQQRHTHFSLHSPPGSQVYLTGTFNDWSPDSIAMKDAGNGHFQQSIVLPEGRHEYKFIVDDTWIADPDCPHWKRNEHGSLNSVIRIPNNHAQ
jgi:1,4-alpha-glucan branching enzyme